MGGGGVNPPPHPTPHRLGLIRVSNSKQQILKSAFDNKHLKLIM